MAQDNDNKAAPSGLQGVAQGVAERAHDYIDKAKDSTAGSADRVATAAHRRVDEAAGTATNAAQWLTQKADDYTRMPQDVLETACERIRAKPLAAVGIALAAGYIIGRLRS